MRTASGGHVRFEKIKIAVVHGKFSHQLPLNFPLAQLTCAWTSIAEMDIELEMKFAVCIFDCLD